MVPPPAVLADPPSPQETSSPKGDRLPVLDLIRGVAILGILPVNIAAFSGEFMSHTGGSAWHEYPAASLVMLLFEGKMVSLLAILFGAGLALQAARAADRRQFARYYRRRMLVLFGLGLANAALLFHFDILTSYAVTGFAALFLVRFDNRALLGAAAGCLAWVWGVSAAIGLLIWVGGGFEPGSAPLPPAAEVVAEAAPPLDLAERIERFFTEEYQTAVFRDGDFWNISLHRAAHLPLLAVLFCLETGWYLLACVLIGICLARVGIFRMEAAPRRWLWWLVGAGLVAACPFHVAALLSFRRDAEAMLYLFFMVGGTLPLALAYLGLLTLWARSRRALWLQERLRAVGRLALSNYLLQSALCGLVFYGYGLRQYGRTDTGFVWTVVAAIWGLQMIASPLWLRRFQMGPVEWLWRRLAGRG